MKPIFQPRKSVFLIDILEKNVTAQEFDRQNAEMEYTVPCRKSVAYNEAEARMRRGKALGRGAYVHRNQRGMLEALKRADMIQHFQETEDGNFSATLKEPAQFIAINPSMDLDWITKDVEERSRGRRGKEARPCVCGEMDCEAAPHSPNPCGEIFLEYFNKHTHNMGQAPRRPHRGL